MKVLIAKPGVTNVGIFAFKAQKNTLSTVDELDRIDNIKKKLLLALEESRGHISDSCKRVGISRASFYIYMNNDPEFKEKVQEITEGVIDYVESQLFKQIEGFDTTSIIFFLKTRGRKRGYSEKEPLIDSETTEVNKSIPFTIIDPKTMGDVNLDIGGADE